MANITQTEHDFDNEVFCTSNRQIFFVKARLISGQVTKKEEFAWVTKNEMAEYLEKELYHNISEFI